ncbi:hypothetical protein [Streptomyces sulphureus]|uniref:hypothetical protein n=1 Tax=Streptomyces sulphureus TaxID=47758 RepID=UPI000373DE6B|nr:hypothetical protein [Streptomyces sulphureus]
MGWTVLYIAFGGVALWLLGEVLMQHKARLRWRVLAFLGFMGVVVGTLMPSMLVIAVGVAAFAVGQTFVTLSYRRGFATGWALGGMPGSSRRRRDDAADSEPSLEVSDLEAGPVPPQAHGAPHAEVQEDAPAAYAAADPGQETFYDPYGTFQDGYAQQPFYGEQPSHAYAFADQQYDQPPQPDPYEYAGYQGYDSYQGYQPWTDGYGQPAYQDPAYGTAALDEGPNVFGGTGYAPQQPYAPQPDHTAAHLDQASNPPYPAATYGWDQGYQPAPTYQQPGDTPPGGVWVPQQRAPEAQQEQQYQSWQQGYGSDGQGVPYTQPEYGYEQYGEYQQPQQDEQQNGYYGDWRY